MSDHCESNEQTWIEDDQADSHKDDDDRIVNRAGRRTRKRRAATAIRFPLETHARLVEAADERDLSVNYLVVKAVEEFLPRLIPVEELSLVRRNEPS